MLEIVACPACRGRLALADRGEWLFCSACRLRYPLRDGIPHLLADQAEHMEPEAPHAGGKTKAGGR